MAITNEILRFVDFWENHGDEKSDTQKFWLDLLRNILSLEYPERFIEFEKRVALEHVSYIDAYIPSTRTIIEQKSFDVNLDKSIMQSDGTSITPFQQAKRYSDWLPDSQRARWIVICNFQEFRIYDMEKPKSEPEIVSLQSLKTQWHKLAFIVNVNSTNIHEVELSVKAGKLVGKLYDSLLERYIDPDDKESQRSLNVFCVRVVFLLYAEDSELFAKSQFHDYLKPRELVARNALRDLFKVINQKEGERDPYLEADLKAFPYVNGGLFAANDIELRNDEVRYCLWLKDIAPSVYAHNREIMRRLEAVRQMRAASTAAPTRVAAELPYKFFSTPQPDSPCLCIPRVSSERRKYIPVAFLKENEIAGDSLSIVHGANLYHFGILTSRVHMAWIKVIGGRLKSDYRYSGDSVYNNFVWPSPNEKQKSKIESTAQKILDVRAQFPDSSLANLYDLLTMPEELLKAHKANDSAVCEAYGWPKDINEEEIVKRLFVMYKELTK